MLISTYQTTPFFKKQDRKLNLLRLGNFKYQTLRLTGELNILMLYFSRKDRQPA
jgi:hypothetical protein